MKPGSVIVDMAAEQGGNCELTHPGEIYTTDNGVTIVGLTDLPSRMANQASQLYGTNLVHLLNDLGGAEGYTVDMEDEVIRGATVILEGQVTWPPPKPEAPAPKAAPAPAPEPVAAVKEAKANPLKPFLWPGLIGLALVGRWCRRTGILPVPLHRLCAGSVPGLEGDLGCVAFAAYPLDERHQCH
jgi:NAD(P) transhydrogenase subunit alpha